MVPSRACPGSRPSKLLGLRLVSAGPHRDLSQPYKEGSGGPDHTQLSSESRVPSDNQCFPENDTLGISRASGCSAQVSSEEDGTSWIPDKSSRGVWPRTGVSPGAASGLTPSGQSSDRLGSRTEPLTSSPTRRKGRKGSHSEGQRVLIACCVPAHPVLPQPIPVPGT